MAHVMVHLKERKLMQCLLITFTSIISNISDVTNYRCKRHFFHCLPWPLLFSFLMEEIKWRLETKATKFCKSFKLKRNMDIIKDWILYSIKLKNQMIV